MLTNRYFSFHPFSRKSIKELLFPLKRSMEIYNFLPKNSLTFVGNSMTTPLAQKVCSWERGDIDISFFLKNLTFSFRNSRKNLGKWVKWPEGVKKLCVELSWLLPPSWDLQKKWNNTFCLLLSSHNKNAFSSFSTCSKFFCLEGQLSTRWGEIIILFSPFFLESPTEFKGH